MFIRIKLVNRNFLYERRVSSSCHDFTAAIKRLAKTASSRLAFGRRRSQGQQLQQNVLSVGQTLFNLGAGPNQFVGEGMCKPLATLVDIGEKGHVGWCQEKFRLTIENL
jgi:hypothetical protein